MYENLLNQTTQITSINNSNNNNSQNTQVSQFQLPYIATEVSPNMEFSYTGSTQKPFHHQSQNKRYHPYG